MLSVMIFCHDKREGDLIGKICNQCVALIDKEFLRNFIISDEEYHQVNIEGIQPPDLLVVEITGIEDLCRAKRIRGIFPRGRLLVVSTNQISAESYLIPEVSPDMLLLNHMYMRKLVGLYTEVLHGVVRISVERKNKKIY